MHAEVTIFQCQEERQLVEEATGAVEGANWTIGRCAAEWVEKYANGRTDGEFADLIGVSRQRVNFARRIWCLAVGCYGGSKLNEHVAACRVAFTWTQWRQFLSLDEKTLSEALATLFSGDEDERNHEALMAIYRIHGGTGAAPAVTFDKTEVPEEAEPVARPADDDWEDDVDDDWQDPEDEDDGFRLEPEPVVRPKPSEPERKPSEQQPKPAEQKPKDDPYPSLKDALKRVAEAELEISDKKKTARLLRTTADSLDPPAKDIPPAMSDVESYCRERGKGVVAEHFFDFYESKGWFVGKNRMVNWKAAVRNAENGGYFREGANGNGNGVKDGDGYGPCPF